MGKIQYHKTQSNTKHYSTVKEQQYNTVQDYAVQSNIYITLQNLALHYIALQLIAPHYSTSHYIPKQYITFYYITCHFECV